MAFTRKGREAGHGRTSDRPTELIVINAYKAAFEAFRFGESSAVGVALLLFSLLFGALYLKSTRALE